MCVCVCMREREREHSNVRKGEETSNHVTHMKTMEGKGGKREKSLPLD